MSRALHAPRRSTMVAALVFVVAFAAYIAFRPDPAPHRRRPAAPTTTTVTTAPADAPTVTPTAAPGA